MNGVKGSTKPKKKLADLVIVDAKPSSDGTTGTFFLRSNNSSGPATKPTNLKVIRWVGSRATAHGTLVPALQPGQTVKLEVDLGGPIEEATHVYARIDDPNSVPEADESNNSFKAK